MEYYLRAGTTEPLDIQIAVTPAQSSVGVVPTLAIQTVTGGVPDPAPTVAWLDAANWRVRIAGLGLIPVGTYRVRIKLTDSADTIAYAPTGRHPDTIVVVAP
jgi:hypothetical protein